MGESLAEVALRQPKNCRHNQSKYLAADNSTSIVTRVLVITAAVLLVVASAGFACFFAWQSGSKIGIELGVLSVVAAAGLKLAEPFCIHGAFASFARFRLVSGAALLVVGLLAIAFSLQAELQYLSTMRSDTASERVNEASTAERADKQYADASAALLMLKPASGSKADLRAFEAQRIALQAVMTAAEADRKAAPAPRVADPGATAIAAYATAAGWKADAASIGIWLPAIGTLAIELGAAFSVLLVRSVNLTVRQPMAPTLEAVTQDVTQARLLGCSEADQTSDSQGAGSRPAVKPSKFDDRDGDDDTPGGGTRGLAALLAHIAANGGAVEGSQRGIARRLGVGLGTLQRAMRDAAASGAVLVDATRSGTRIALT